MKRIVIPSIAILGVAMVVARGYVARRAEAALIAPAEMGARTPATVGLAFSSFTFPSDDRHLLSWIVRAPDTASVKVAVLVFHGNRASVAQQVAIQRVLFDHDITSMVFDYSGFGGSGGRPTVHNLRQDAVAAYRVFADSVGPLSRKYLLGTSLGASVLLSAIDEIQTSVDGVVVVGTFASGREIAVRQGRVPRGFAFLLPNLYDNVAAARRVAKPLLVVHSNADALFPIEGAERIVEAAAGAARLVRLEDVAHDAYLSNTADWEEVIDFIRAR